MILYADTSALVKLYVQESGSSSVKAYFAGASGVVTSAVTLVEVHSALERKLRERSLTPRERNAARQDFEKDWLRFAAVELRSDLLEEAAALVQRYPLRTLDAIHLASALDMRRSAVSVLVVGSSGTEIVTPDAIEEFLCADDQLAAAARSEGFTVPLIPTE